ncbi:MAG: hypothetical protein AAFU64_08690, partial [Bacteroidota bacterium]
MTSHKQLFLLLLSSCFYCTGLWAQNVGINDDGSSPDPSAMLHIQSTNKGVLVPRLTSTERNAISSPANGLLVFDATTSTFWFYDGGQWLELAAAADNRLRDTDIDTQIQVEKSSDDDRIRFDIAGVEKMVLGTNLQGIARLEVLNNNLNTLLGEASGAGLSSGISNTFIGARSGSNNTIGNQNTFLGDLSGNHNSSGSFNVFLGEQAGLFNTTGSRNIFIGNSTGKANTTGFENVFLGFESGRDNTTAQFNVFLGSQSGLNNTTQNNNTFVGAFSGQASQASGNTFIGSRSGSNNSSGSNNTFVGLNSGQFSTTGANNTFLGRDAGQLNGSGVNNVYLGMESAFAGTGSQNTFLGYQSGRNATGSSNVFLGHQAGLNETGNEKLYIDNSGSTQPLIYGDFAQDSLVFNGSGLFIRDGNSDHPQLRLLEIGNSQSRLQMGNSVLSEIFWEMAALPHLNTNNSTLTFRYSGSGNVLVLRANGNAVLSGSLTSSSDRRLKTNF